MLYCYHELYDLKMGFEILYNLSLKNNRIFTPASFSLRDPLARFFYIFSHNAIL